MTTVERVLSGRYQLEQLLASGGMGAVWRARDLRLERAVAVKELTGAGLALPMAVQRFDREARAVARLAHPNIVALHDVGVEDGRPYLVMELVDGRSVAAILEEGPLPAASAVAVAAQTCDGLAAAHAAGIIHRDIKPGNLLLTDTGVAKICDFGIARLHDAAGDITLTGVASPLGSYKYVAPEQASGEPVDARTDLYALGCTLYAMLAGAPPFSGNHQAVVHQHLTQPPPPLPTNRDGIPSELEALVQQLLSKAPEQRPADALEVRSRLAAIAQDLATDGVPTPRVRLTVAPEAATPHVTRPPTPQPEGFGEPSPAAPRRRLPAIAGAALVVAAVLAVLGVIRWLPRADDIDAGAVPPVVAGTSGAPTASISIGAVAPLPTATTNRPVRDDRAVAPTHPAVSVVSASSRSTSSSPTPGDPIVAMRLSIRQQVDAGHLNPARAADLYKKVDDIAHATNDGHPADAAKKVKEFRDKLAELHDTGTLTTAGYDRLTADLDRLADSLSLTEPPGPPEPGRP
jgi:eukaryotic-like serine/threonine-protein kinase